MRRILRARSVPLAAAAIAATTLAWLVPSAAANASPHTRPAAPSPGRAAAPVRHAATSLNAPSDTGASDISNLGAIGWAVQSSAVATQTGAQISVPGFNTSAWLPVANDDAGAPGTEIEALAQNGQCPTLIVNGVVGSANVWVNGTEVATSATVTGAYTRFTFNLTSLIRPSTK